MYNIIFLSQHSHTSEHTQKMSYFQTITIILPLCYKDHTSNQIPFHWKAFRNKIPGVTRSDLPRFLNKDHVSGCPISLLHSQYLIYASNVVNVLATAIKSTTDILYHIQWNLWTILSTTYTSKNCIFNNINRISSIGYVFLEQLYVSANIPENYI